ncbi:MAG TPA: glycosyltransferase, partial [Candidatus Acidoferrales bacterium]|nr:glycosyltransferase [Candidatus Acidoferrales bacterium]
MKYTRILVLVDCYLPSYKSGAKQMHDLSVELLRYASEVTVLTTSHEISPAIDFSMEEGVRVIRVRTPRIKGAGHVARAITEMRLSLLVWRRARRYLLNHPADLIIFYSPSIFWGALVRRLKTLWRCRTYLILRDIFPEWAADAGVLNRGFVYKLFRRQAIKQYDTADVIAVQSPGDLAYFHRNFSEKCHRLETLHNWTRLNESILPKT